jgi:hypothetical protein
MDGEACFLDNPHKVELSLEEEILSKAKQLLPQKPSNFSKY